MLIQMKSHGATFTPSNPGIPRGAAPVYTGDQNNNWLLWVDVRYALEALKYGFTYALDADGNQIRKSDES